MKDFLECSAIALIGLVAGFFIGRNSVQLQTETVYVKGDTIYEKVAIPIPYQVEIPSEPIYIYRTDTLTDRIVQKVDTAAILNDWISKREYNQQVFNNKYGTLSLSTAVQYNRLQKVEYSYIPLQKQTTILKSKTWTPFVEASYNTLNYVSIGGGLYYNDLGFSLKYTTDLNKKGMDIGLKYKF